MVRYMDLEEQVDNDYNRARQKAFLRRMKARLRRDPVSDRLLSFEEARKNSGALNRIHLGTKVVRVEKIVGSVSRFREFDRVFLPTKESVRTKWKRIARAFYKGEELPPVELYKIGDEYFVLDGNHRVSVARYQGVEMIDAYVTEFRARLPQGWSQPDGSSGRGEPKKYEMVDPQESKRRHEQMLREAEQDRLAKELRAARRRRTSASRLSALIWELKRYAGRLRKLLRIAEKDGQRTKK